MLVDIVIINWNAGDLLARCVASVLLPGNYRHLGVCFVVDNASNDRSADNLPADEKVIVIRNLSNLGFAKACNQAFKACSQAFVLLLNPDACLDESTLGNSLAFMQQHQQIDIMGACHRNDTGTTVPSCSRFPKPLNIFFDAAGLSKLFPKVFKPATLMTDWDHAQSMEVAQVMGAFMFMRAKLFAEIGYFDERFFVYFEELDFSKRLADAGGISFYNKEIAITHSGGGTTNSVKSFRLFLFLKSRLQYASKHFKPAGKLVVFISTWFFEPVARVVLALLKGRFSDIGAIAGGFRMLLFAR